MKKFILPFLLCALTAFGVDPAVTKNSQNVISNGPINIGAGNTLTIQSGATLNVASGATFNFSGGISWSSITGTPTTLAGYGITDPIVLTSSSYADPAWITSLAATKLTGTVAAARMPAFTGDATSSAGAVALTLATVNSNVGSFGSATAVPAITVNAKGLITAVSSVTVTPAWASITGTPTTVSGYGITNALVTTNNLSDLNSAATSRTNLGLGTLATQSGTFSGTSSGTNTGDQTIFLSGDVSGSGTGAISTVLAASGVTAASYGDATHVGQFTVDSKGRITTAANVTISASGTGSVLSVAAADLSPLFTTVVNSPTVNPSIVFSLSNATANRVFAGPTTGSPAAPTYRALVAADLPNTAVSAGAYGSATASPTFTVDATGRLTAAANVTIAPPFSAITGTAGPTQGGTGLTGYAQGDLIYASALNTLATLAKNTSSTRYISNTGTSNGPAWAQIDMTNGVTGILTSANGGTGNGFVKFAGPATSEKTYTGPNANAVLLTDNAPVTAAQGGFGIDVSAQSGVPLFATGTPTFTGTSGTGNFARVTSPTFVTPILGTPTSGTLTNTTGFPIANLAGAGTNVLAALANTANGASGIAVLTAGSDLNIAGGDLTFTGASSITGGAGSMTITSGTGNSRTLALQTTTSGGTATTAVTFDATQGASFAGVAAFAGATISSSTGAIFPTSTTALSSLRMPHGTAPTSPVNGDMWTTTSGLNVRINGSTVLLSSAGSGTVTVVGAGNLTSTAFMTGGGSQAAQTPSATSTLDSSGNAIFAGTVSSGAGLSTAGGFEFVQGTANTAGTNSVTIQAPASITTAYTRTLEGSAGSSGFYFGTVSGTAVTDSKVSANGTGNVLLSAGTAAIASGKTLTVSNSITFAGTDGTTITFPTTSATLARTDAGNTFTGASSTSGWTLASSIIAGGLTASGSGSNNFGSSSGTFITSTGANTLSGATTINDATTPSVTTASGKTNTGFFQVNGKTSGAFKITAADTAAQTVTMTIGSQTSGAATVTVPDMAGVSDTYSFLGKAENITGAKTMSSIILPTAGQIRSTVPTGDLTATGPTTNAYNCGYTSSAIGDLVYLDSSNTWQKADADASATTYSGMLAIALEVKASGAALLVAMPGSYIYSTTGFPTFTVGGTLYMSATAGAITQTAPTATDSCTRVIGWAIHADKIYFQPSPDWITHT